MAPGTAAVPMKIGVFDSGVGGIPVIEQACPLLVPMVEEGWLDHSILHQTLAEYVSPHLNGARAATGIALLGCTHYPWIQEAFERALPGWTIVNSAEAVGDALRLAPGAGRGQVEWIFTDPAAVPAFARKLITEFKDFEGVQDRGA